MKKVALVFLLAVFVPSLVLAWLAVRSLRDQQFVLEREQSLLYQGVADAIAKGVQGTLAEDQRDFTLKVGALLQSHTGPDVAKSFDDLLRKDWPLAEVGFVVTLGGDILCPSPLDRPEAKTFCIDNSRFLANRESAEVYLQPKQALNNQATPLSGGTQESNFLKSDTLIALEQSLFSNKGQTVRKVVPQQQAGSFQKSAPQEEIQQPFSKVAASEAEFRQ